MKLWNELNYLLNIYHAESGYTVYIRFEKKG